MPIYEYRCQSCGHELEALQKISEPALTACPDCRTDSLVKQVSAAGFQLKGSGWYATDFRNGSKPAAKSEAKSDGAAEAKSESKPDSPAPAAGCGGNCSCH
jgi:putative FmdB family regulatory protein